MSTLSAQVLRLLDRINTWSTNQAYVFQGLPQRATTFVLHADILTLPTASIPLVPAPGAGYWIRPVRASYFSDTLAGAYTGINTTYSALQLTLGGEWVYSPIVNDSSVTGLTDLTNFLQVEDAQVAWASAYLEAPAASGRQYIVAQRLQREAVENQPLVLSIDNNSVNLGGGNAVNTLGVTYSYLIERLDP